MTVKTVVTGYGAISPYGVGADALVNGFRAGHAAVRAMGDEWRQGVRGTSCSLAAPVMEEIDTGSIPRKNRRSMARSGLLAFLAAGEALAAADIPLEMAKSGRLGVALGETLTGPASLEQFFRSYLVERDVSQVPANGFFQVMGHSCAANVAAALGATGRVQATPGACASGALAQVVGVGLIRAGLQDVVLCGGAEECTPATSAIFDIVGAASTHFNDRPDLAPAPFDRDRDGTVCGEGAAVLALEAADSAAARGARVLGNVLGVASNCDGGKMAHPGVESMAACMRAALADAGLQPEDIDYVNAHATGTVEGDSTEAAAIGAVFGPHMAVSSLKGHIGHTLGASGAIESIMAIEMLRGGYIVPTAKLRHVSDDCAVVRHVRALEVTPLRRIMKCSFGFGGINVVLVFGRMDDGAS